MTNFVRCTAVLALLTIMTGSVCADDKVLELIRDGNAALRSRDFETAIEKYNQARELRPQLAEPIYNAGVARYHQRDFALARKAFKAVLDSEQSKLRSRARFNLGNCDYAEALPHVEDDPQTAVSMLKSAVDNYLRVLADNREHSKARTNAELALRLIEQLSGQEQQQNKQQQEDQQEQSESDSQQANDNADQQDENSESDSQPSTDGNKEEPPPKQQQNSGENQQDEQQQDQNGDDGEQSPDAKNRESDPANQSEGAEDDSSTEQDSDANESPSEETQQDSSQQPTNDTPGKDQAPPTPSPTGDGEEPEEPTPQSSADDSQLVEKDENDSASAVPSGNETNQPLDTGTQRMTRLEALKLLQAVRDRDLKRRQQQMRLRQQQRIRVDKDW